MTRSDISGPYVAVAGIPRHLEDWRLPPEWRWGGGGVFAGQRHYQEVVDALGRSLSLVTAPNPAHSAWLSAEARHLAHLGHPSIPTTYHYWVNDRQARRGPGYLRRWIAGETVGSRMAREGADDVGYALALLRAAGSAIAYLHDAGTIYGALSPDTLWVTPGTRFWLAQWQWALPRADIPAGLMPDRRWTPVPPEWDRADWRPTIVSDQWQLAALCFAALTGERPPTRDIPPLAWVRPELPQDIAQAIDRALGERPRDRFPSVPAFLRAVDRAIGARSMLIEVARAERDATSAPDRETEEARVRWAVADDYEVLALLGSGTFGTVWRVRDLALEREVALKALHPAVSGDQRAVSRFRREAKLAAQLAHPAIVPIYDWDSRGDVSWYTMELEEGGSLADLVARTGARPLVDVAPQVELILEGLSAAHAHGIIHRDLKPENVLLDRYRRWRITDFGIANIPGEELPGATGTPAFAAPEQLLGDPQGPAVDCFAVAAIVVYVVTGMPPFGAGDAKGILRRQLAGDVGLDAFPPELAAWLRRGFAPAPDDRFAEAADMLGALRSALSTMRRRARPWWTRALPGARSRRPGDDGRRG
ncbi:MAG: serine/threonine-protein kinase [Gemmatimonadaceae bacterium]